MENGSRIVSKTTRLVQAKNIGCKEFINPTIKTRDIDLKTKAGNKFQNDVVKDLEKNNRAISYEKLLEIINCKDLIIEENGIFYYPPINKTEVLSALKEHRKEIFNLIDNLGKDEIYISLPAEKKGIPVLVNMSDFGLYSLDDTNSEYEIDPDLKDTEKNLSKYKDKEDESINFLDLIYLKKINNSTLGIGGVEVKLSSKPHAEHYDQVTVYMYSIENKIKENSIKELKVLESVRLILTSMSSVYSVIEHKITSFEKAYKQIVEKTEQIKKFTNHPISSACFVCSNMDTCFDEAINKKTVSAFKSLPNVVDFFEEKAEMASTVKENQELFEKELQLIPDPIFFDEEYKIVEEKGFWQDYLSLPDVKKYRHRVSIFNRNTEAIMSIFAYPSMEDIFSLLTVSISFYTKNKEKLKGIKENIESFMKKEYEAQPLREIQLKIDALGEYEGFTIVLSKGEMNGKIDFTFIKIVEKILKEYKARRDGKGLFKWDRQLFVAYLDTDSKEIIKRVLEKYLITTKNISWTIDLEKIFAALELKDKNIQRYYYNKSGSNSSDLIQGIFVTNEPFLFSYPSLLAVNNFIDNEKKEERKDSINYNLISILKGKYDFLTYETSLKLNIKSLYERFSSRISLIDPYKLEKNGICTKDCDCIDYRSVQMNKMYFDYLALLSYLPLKILISI